jgi:spermidine synthase
MKNWLKDASINTDRNLRLQYLAGLGLNLYQSDPIYKSMIRDSRYPDQLFEGSAETLDALRQRITESLGGRPQF